MTMPVSPAERWRPRKNSSSFVTRKSSSHFFRTRWAWWTRESQSVKSLVDLETSPLRALGRSDFFFLRGGTLRLPHIRRNGLAVFLHPRHLPPPLERIRRLIHHALHGLGRKTLQEHLQTVPGVIVLVHQLLRLILGERDVRGVGRGP